MEPAAPLIPTVLEAAIAGILIVLAGRQGIAAPVCPISDRMARLRTFRSALCGSAWITVGVCTAAALSVSLLVSFFRPPVPQLHDEFSYLLAADTYAHGRMANLPHELWPHFESMHILQQPTYASKYPPAQGLFLAIGQRLTGNPLAGVWLSTACAVAAVCWMLRQWLTAEFALVGGLLTATHAGLLLTWGQSFMGGAPAVIGTSLVFGAYKIWRQDISMRAAFIAAAGLALLANSRPFEGLLVSLPVLAAVGVSIVRRLPAAGVRQQLTAILPGTLLLLTTVGAMAVYNREVTGSALTLPYAVHSKTYMAGPLFLWQAAPATPAYQHAILHTFHTDWETDAWRAQSTLFSFLHVKGLYYAQALRVLFCPVLAIAILTGISAIVRNPGSTSPDTDSRPATRQDGALVLMALFLLFLGSAFAVWVFPHYLAPAVPLGLLLAGLGAQSHGVAPDGAARHPSALVWRLIGTHVVVFTVIAVWFAEKAPVGWQHDREDIAATLNRTPGRDLVIVTYNPEHSPHEEWVYNGADIQNSPVVWARDMGPDRNAHLTQHFSDRRIWRLNPDDGSELVELARLHASGESAD